MAAIDVSVVVPTYSRPERLSRLLVALTQQTLAPDRFEVIVVDDGSPPGSRPTHPLPASNQHLFRQDNSGPASARNAGAARAQGNLLVFIDDDCLPDAAWLQALSEAHRETPEAMLGGHTENGLPDNLYSATSESLMLFFDEDAVRRSGRIDFLASNNLALATADFLRLGGFDTSYPLAAGEDRELCRRWQQTGRCLHRVQAARVRHFHGLSLASFWRQHRNYGRGAARFHEAPEARGARPALGFYTRLLFHPLTQRPDWPVGRRIGATGLVMVSQLAIVSGLMRERSAQASRTTTS